MNREEGERHIEVSLAEQRLTLFQGGEVLRTYPVSTARNGPGERMGSERTPRGRHRIRAMIGAGCPPNTVFVGRRPTGEIYTPELGRRHPERDWILTRILWLCGMEPGFNRFGQVDSMRRYIYIHGCPDSEPMGVPRSHGCIRMRNADIIDLFDRICVGTPVNILADRDNIRLSPR
ncbi:MAG TPA: murein L,D-transpeptidase [Thiotrichales bacterium]|nr:murein L,D-transpeptidase [Thiotrichales bacterium]